VIIWERIKRLNGFQLFELGFLFLKNPLFVIPSLKATKSTFRICNTLFGNDHNKSSKANAFRHALWNILICVKTLKTTQNKQLSIDWAEKVTNLYEKVTKNEVLDKVMDLHNNAVGRKLFFRVFDHSEEELIRFLLKKLEKAQKIEHIEDVKNFENDLVYILDT
jgi:hypothetical protein